MFGVEENKDLLISLINSIVSQEDQVADVTLLNPYNLQNFKDDKLSILDGAEFEGRHPWLGEDFCEMMVNPIISSGIKQEMFQKMQNDPLLVGVKSQSSGVSKGVRDGALSANLLGPGRSESLANPFVRASDLPQLNPFALSESTGYKFPWDVRVGYRADVFKAPVIGSSSGANFGDLMLDPRFNRHALLPVASAVHIDHIISPYREVDPEAGKPQILSMPIPDKPVMIWSTPDERERMAELTKPRGFAPEPVKLEDLIETHPIHEYDWKDLVLLKEVDDHSIKARLKEQQLPIEGKIRFVPREDYVSVNPLKKGINHGFYDRFGNEWVKRPSRTEGEAFEWDVQLSKTGRAKLGHLSRDGKHINVSLKGKITH